MIYLLSILQFYVRDIKNIKKMKKKERKTEESQEFFIINAREMSLFYSFLSFLSFKFFYFISTQKSTNTETQTPNPNMRSSCGEAWGIPPRTHFNHRRMAPFLSSLVSIHFWLAKQPVTTTTRRNRFTKIKHKKM